MIDRKQFSMLTFFGRTTAAFLPTTTSKISLSYGPAVALIKKEIDQDWFQRQTIQSY